MAIPVLFLVLKGFCYFRLINKEECEYGGGMCVAGRTNTAYDSRRIRRTVFWQGVAGIFVGYLSDGLDYLPQPYTGASDDRIEPKELISRGAGKFGCRIVGRFSGDVNLYLFGNQR